LGLLFGLLGRRVEQLMGYWDVILNWLFMLNCALLALFMVFFGGTDERMFFFMV
jgi:hypothetical protein